MESDSEESLKRELEELQKLLGKKLRFEEAVRSLHSLLRELCPSASHSLRKLVLSFILSSLFHHFLLFEFETQIDHFTEYCIGHIKLLFKLNEAIFWMIFLITWWSQFYSVVCRVATILKTRYTAPGFWLAGLRLFEQAECTFSDPSEKEHLKKCIAQAKDHLHNIDNPQTDSQSSENRGLFSYLFR